MALILDNVVTGTMEHESTNMLVSRTAFPNDVFPGQLLDDLLIVSSDIDITLYTQAPQDEDGHALRTSMDDWYFRLHFFPYALNLGNLSGDQERELTLWNAFFTTKDIEAFEVINGEGIDVTEENPAPFTLAPLQTTRYTFEISASGPPQIDATATWTIDGEEFEVPVTGRRTTLFAFSPNWRSTVRETLEWRTVVNTSFDGFEHRATTRNQPRRIFDYQMRLHNEDARLFDILTFGWTGRMFSLPLWHEKSKLTADAAAGATTLYLDTAGVTLAVDGNAILYAGTTDTEDLQVLAVFSDRITLKGPLTRDWPAGSAVFPTLVAMPPESFATARRSDTHLDTAGRFTASPVDCIPRLPAVAAPATYRGEELYTDKTNWRGGLSIQIEARRTVVDVPDGPLRVKPKATWPLVTRGFSWLLKTRVIAEDLRAFFVRRVGRRVPVWIPSGTNDFTLLDDIDLGQTSFVVRKSQYGDFVVGEPARSDVVFIMRDGARYARRIVSVVPAGADTLLQVDSDFPVVVEPANIKSISYLGLYRLGSDSVTFTWHTDQVAEVDVQFVLTEPSE